MKKGDYIKVNSDTKDPDYKGNDLSGFSGHIEDIDDNYVTILWDEPTLAKFTRKTIRRCDRKGLDHTRMVLTRIIHEL
jgi:hypothetical protein